jgi:integrase
MSRTPEDAEITTRAARERLEARHEPYWRSIEGGIALGYRKGARGGVWMARQFAAGKYRKVTLSRADDQQKATLVRAEELAATGSNAKVMDYRQAQASALAWAARMDRVAAGLEAEPDPAPAQPYTIREAISDYLTDFAARGGKGIAQTRRAANAHIIPALGNLVVSAVKQDRIKKWHRNLASAPARVRSKTGTISYRPPVDDPDALRKRRASANRILTVLKASLNHARAEGRVTGLNQAWADVKPFREVDQAKVRYLLDDEAVRLVNACETDFRQLVTAALLTGCRYGELTVMKAADFDTQAGIVTVGKSKSGNVRHVVLTDEGSTFFNRQTEGKTSGALLFQRDVRVKQATRSAPAQNKRAAWGGSHQFRPLCEVCAKASIVPAVSFHILRHTYASRLARAGVPMAVIAAQLGHKDTRMTEKHYAHLAPSYIADTVRRSFSPLGIGLEENG